MTGDVNSVTMQPGIVTVTVLSTMSYQKSFNHFEAHFDMLKPWQVKNSLVRLDLSRRIILVFFPFVLQEEGKWFMTVGK